MALTDADIPFRQQAITVTRASAVLGSAQPPVQVDGPLLTDKAVKVLLKALPK